MNRLVGNFWHLPAVAKDDPMRRRPLTELLSGVPCRLGGHGETTIAGGSDNSWDLPLTSSTGAT